MRSWTEQHSNHVSQNRAAQKKSLVTRVTSAFQPIAVTARLSHATHHRLAPSWVGDLNEKLPLGRGTAEFSFTRIFSATVQSLPAEPQSHKQLGFYILYDYLPQPKKKTPSAGVLPGSSTEPSWFPRNLAGWYLPSPGVPLCVHTSTARINYPSGLNFTLSLVSKFLLGRGHAPSAVN